MDTRFYTNKDAQEQMLIVVDGAASHVRFNRGNDVVVDFKFDTHGVVIGSPIGSLVELLKSSGSTGPTLEERLHAFVNDKTCAMIQRELLVRSNNHAGIGDFGI